MSTSTHSDLMLLRRLLLQARPYWPHIVGVLLLSLSATPIALLTPLPLTITVDSVIGSHPLPQFLNALLPSGIASTKSATLGIAVGLLLLVTILSLLQKSGTWLLGEYTGERMVLSFRSRLFQHVQRLSLAYHDTAGISDATYRIQYDAPAIQGLTTWGFIPFVTAAFTLAGMIYVTARISMQLAIVAMAVSPILAFLTWFYSRRLHKQWERVKDRETSALSVLQEVLGAIRVVMAFRQEDRELERFVSQSSKGLWERLRVLLTESSLSLFVGLTLGVGTATVLFIGVGEVQAGDLTLGELILVMSYLAQLYSPLYTIGKQIAGQQGSLVSAKRAFSLLDQSPAVAELKGAKPLSRAEGIVNFHNVSFSYQNSHLVLHNISFDVSAGKRVGITGPTGAGKTTLMNLLIRFYDPALDDLRNQFAIVLQEPILFSNSIGANIAYALPEATMNHIIEAAKAANAHDFIVNLPQGYETPVGERGMQLSGGERQRIALARAFLKDAPILILDEPTSSVDIQTEAIIMEAMERLMKGRTSFMITHRLRTLENCDMLLMIENGKIAGATSEVLKTITNVQMLAAVR
jgi:ATP-binding cassette subfamily B protein